jgi:hypothetical protein
MYPIFYTSMSKRVCVCDIYRNARFARQRDDEISLFHWPPSHVPNRGTIQISTANSRSLNVCRHKSGKSQIRTRKDSSTTIGPVKRDAAAVSIAQVSVGQIRLPQAGAIKIGIPEIDSVYIAASEFGTTKIGPLGGQELPPGVPLTHAPPHNFEMLSIGHALLSQNLRSAHKFS